MQSLLAGGPATRFSQTQTHFQLVEAPLQSSFPAAPGRQSQIFPTRKSGPCSLCCSQGSHSDKEPRSQSAVSSSSHQQGNQWSLTLITLKSKLCSFQWWLHLVFPRSLAVRGGPWSNPSFSPGNRKETNCSLPFEAICL